MAQHLLMAADRYGMHRLRLIVFEEKLCNNISLGTAATIMAVAEPELHYCQELKDACLDFSHLSVFCHGARFESLRTSCPSLVKELIAKCSIGMP